MKVYAVGLDANEIFPGLWQGSFPPEGSYLASIGFKVVVFCADDLQPSQRRYPGLDVIYAPNDDDSSRPITAEELRIAVNASRAVAKAVRSNRPTLVTCKMGWNRSGLVVALALHRLTGKSGADCLEHVQTIRHNALYNGEFQKVLLGIKPRQTSPTSR